MAVLGRAVGRGWRGAAADLRIAIAAVCLAGLAALALMPVSAGVARAQDTSVNPARDCQTVRTCNFSRRGKVRGCLSSYTCRICKTVRTRCNLAGRRYCQQVVCTWGG